MGFSVRGKNHTLYAYTPPFQKHDENIADLSSVILRIQSHH